MVLANAETLVSRDSFESFTLQHAFNQRASQFVHWLTIVFLQAVSKPSLEGLLDRLLGQLIYYFFQVTLDGVGDLHGVRLILLGEGNTERLQEFSAGV